MVEESKSSSNMASSSSSSTATKAKTPMPSASAETTAPYPKMDLAQKIHQITTMLSNKESQEKSSSTIVELQEQVFDQIINELENPSLYKLLVEKIGSTTTLKSSLTPEQLKTMEDKNTKELELLNTKVDEAKESAGDMEVLDAKIAIAKFCAKSMSYDETITAYTNVIELSKISSGKKIDCYMELARVASFYNKTVIADTYIENASKLANDGGGTDWDRRNRLKVYKSLQLLLHRNTNTASILLVDCIATFSCTEICSYSEFIIFAIITNLLHLPRPQLKSKILDCPEIVSIATEIPIVMKLVQSFYECDYNTYLHSMLEVEEVLIKDRYLYPHTSYWMKELHILGYKQFLDSYQSVTLDAMAKTFGVSISFIDYHASRFIATGRLSAKIDKFGGVIITNRPDIKNSQYRDMIQKGDLLLNRIQKLSRVVDL